MKKHMLTMLCLLSIAFSFGQKQGKITEVTEQTMGNHDIPFAVIEEAPVYPGCTGNDKVALKKCFSESITKHIQKTL